MRSGALWSTIAALAVLHGGCIDVPGMTEGGPCNAKEQCTKGLVCEEGICKPEDAVIWRR